MYAAAPHRPAWRKRWRKHANKSWRWLNRKLDECHPERERALSEVRVGVSATLAQDDIRLIFLTSKSGFILHSSFFILHCPAVCAFTCSRTCCAASPASVVENAESNSTVGIPCNAWRRALL